MSRSYHQSETALRVLAPCLRQVAVGSSSPFSRPLLIRRMQFIFYLIVHHQRQQSSLFDFRLLGRDADIFPRQFRARVNRKVGDTVVDRIDGGTIQRWDDRHFFVH